VTAEEAIEAATRWLEQTARPHGAVRSASFLWRFELERWAERFCYHSYQQWRQAIRERPVEERFVLIEKWRVVFDLPGVQDNREYGVCVAVDIDDRTGSVRLGDGW
jgi:hypothetical protein